MDAEVLIEAGGDAVTESAEVASDAQLTANLTWHSELFRYHVARARLAEAVGTRRGSPQSTGSRRW